MTTHYLIRTHIEPDGVRWWHWDLSCACTEISSRAAFQFEAIITHCSWYYFNSISVFLLAVAWPTRVRVSRRHSHSNTHLWPRVVQRGQVMNGFGQFWNAVSRIDVIGWFFGRSRGHKQLREHLISNTLRLLQADASLLNWSSSRFVQFREIL